MAKQVIVPASPEARYQHSDGRDYTYPPGRVIEVGSVAGLHSAVDDPALAANDTIRIVWPGTYKLQKTLVQRVANLHIEGAGDSPDDIVLEGLGMDEVPTGPLPMYHGIYSQVPGLRVSNLTLQKFFQHGVTFGAGATDPIFTDVNIWDCGQQFIKASAFPAAINNGRVTRCLMGYTAGRPTFDHNGFFYGSPIDVHNGAGWIVSDSIFTEIAPTAAEIAAATAANPSATQNWWAPAVYFWNRSSNNIVERCGFVNCGRAVAFGLVQRGGGEYDNQDGIIRNNMCVVTPGRFGAEQIADSDGQIIAWDSPNTKILHNTILVYGQCANAIQGRWSAALDIASNLSDATNRLRDSATATGGNNIQSALAAWFVNPAGGNLRLNATGNSNVGLAARLADCLDDIDRVARATSTKIGADIYG